MTCMSFMVKERKQKKNYNGAKVKLWFLCHWSGKSIGLGVGNMHVSVVVGSFPCFVSCVWFVFQYCVVQRINDKEINKSLSYSISISIACWNVFVFSVVFSYEFQTMHEWNFSCLYWQVKKASIFIGDFSCLKTAKDSDIRHLQKQKYNQELYIN